MVLSIVAFCLMKGMQIDGDKLGSGEAALIVRSI